MDLQEHEGITILQQLKTQTYEKTLNYELEKSILHDNPLKHAIENKYLSAVKYYIENADTVKDNNDILIDIHYNDNYPLKWALYHGYLSIVKLLHQKGCKIQNTEYLHIAIKNSHYKLVEYLLQYELDIYTESEIFLITAIQNKDIEIIKLLLFYGADCTESDRVLQVLITLYLDEDISKEIFVKIFNLLSESFSKNFRKMKLTHFEYNLYSDKKVAEIKNFLVENSVILPKTKKCVML